MYIRASGNVHGVTAAIVIRRRDRTGTAPAIHVVMSGVQSVWTCKVDVHNIWHVLAHSDDKETKENFRLSPLL